MRELLPFKGASRWRLRRLRVRTPAGRLERSVGNTLLRLSIPVDSGCHPNPDGHALMADLMMELYDPEFVRLSPPRDIRAEALPPATAFWSAGNIRGRGISITTGWSSAAPRSAQRKQSTSTSPHSASSI
jgi:hypothetical protein